MTWYTRAGEKMTPAEYERLVDVEYRRVALDYIKHSRMRVSTVWLGCDHRHDTTIGKPLIFETVVFVGDSFEECAHYSVRRYSSESAAIIGHRETVARAEGIAYE